MVDIRTDTIEPALAASEGRWRPPVYWSAIVAGVVASIVAQFLLNLLGIGIGAALVDPTGGGGTAAEAVQGGATAAFVWWAISGILGGFVGGWIAGYLTAQAGRGNETLHGFFTWGIAALVIVFLMTSAVGAAGRTVGNIAGPIASQVGQFAQIEELRDLVAQAAQGAQVEAEPGAGGQQIYTVTTADGREVTISQAEINQRAEQAADAVASGALWTFLALLVGAAAAIFGAGIGGKTRLPDGRVPTGAEGEIRSNRERTAATATR